MEGRFVWLGGWIEVFGRGGGGWVERGSEREVRREIPMHGV